MSLPDVTLLAAHAGALRFPKANAAGAPARIVSNTVDDALHRFLPALNSVRQQLARTWLDIGGSIAAATVPHHLLGCYQTLCDDSCSPKPPRQLRLGPGISRMRDGVGCATRMLTYGTTVIHSTVHVYLMTLTSHRSTASHASPKDVSQLVETFRPSARRPSARPSRIGAHDGLDLGATSVSAVQTSPRRWCHTVTCLVVVCSVCCGIATRRFMQSPRAGATT